MSWMISPSDKVSTAASFRAKLRVDGNASVVCENKANDKMASANISLTVEIFTNG
jgi:hypothetical protein